MIRENGPLRFFVRYRWLLPVASAILLIMAMPPINLWPLAGVALVPLFLFIYIRQQRWRLLLGVGIFSLIQAGYLTLTIMYDFHWIKEAALFSFLFQTAGAIAVLVVVALSVVYAYCLWWLITIFSASYIYVLHHFYEFDVVGEEVLDKTGRRKGDSARVAIYGIGFLSYLLLEVIYQHIFAGFNYGALFFAAQHATYLVPLAALGSPIYMSGAVLLINIAIWATVLLVAEEISTSAFLNVFLICVVLVAVMPLWAKQLHGTAPISRTESVAVIQNANVDPVTAFGHVTDGTFTFPQLEQQLATIAPHHPDFIVYPFAPWSGIISSKVDNGRFDRKVIVIDDATFDAWLKTHVPANTIFVTWYTRYQHGQFYNQIAYYKNGKLLGVYNKHHLFPFFDYTPAWALKEGVVSLPYDATAGTSSAPVVYQGLKMGSLVCSEIGNDSSTAASAAKSNIIFSLGSETMFSQQIPGEYNLLRAQLSAEKYAIPIVRADRQGPSAVYSANGRLLGKLGYEKTGVLYVNVPIPSR